MLITARVNAAKKKKKKIGGAEKKNDTHNYPGPKSTKNVNN